VNRGNEGAYRIAERNNQKPRTFNAAELMDMKLPQVRSVVLRNLFGGFFG
jgi:hypothetical protein